MKVQVRLGVPPEAGGVDLEAVRAVFPYGWAPPCPDTTTTAASPPRRLACARTRLSDLPVSDLRVLFGCCGVPRPRGNAAGSCFPSRWSRAGSLSRAGGS